MSQVTLYGAFVWECEECGSEQFERATEADMDTEVAEGIVSEHFETLEAKYHGSDYAESSELITRVLLGPAFVECGKCGAMFAAQLPVE